MAPTHTNALIDETSPYLLQHAHNPVDWLPWGEAALSKARDENKLIFLSIGYAACHWCHVMEHESFEDETVAETLNRDFVPVKVDREERPDLDEIYMTATIVFTGGQGGWPMSVFLAPDLRPVFAGTYFPRENMYGRPGFRTLLQLIQEKWRNEPDALLEDSEKVLSVIRQAHDGSMAGSALTAERLDQAAGQVRRAFDPASGGIPSGSNKFPPSMAMELLLRRWRASDDKNLLALVELTLQKMGEGGIYDHLGGGIHRYSTDPKWLVPHFEKMLYDQALVVGAYIDGMQATDNAELAALCADRARGICDYVLRDLTDPGGAFYSSEDADSEGLEGKFYIWTRDEVYELLDEQAAHLFCSHYGVTEFGNWDHPGDEHVPHGPKNILHVARPAATIARLEKLDAAEVERSLAESRRTLFALREKRVRPGLDDKILSGWNGLMIAALAKAADALDEPRYADAAARAADFIWENMRPAGRLAATYGKGEARLTAYASDYAFLTAGLIGLFEAAGDSRRLDQAAELTETLLAHYWDEDGGGLFFTADDHEELLVRSKTANDGATPSANSVAAMNFLKLAVLLDRSDLRDRAQGIFETFGEAAVQQPFQGELLLSAADAALEGFVEVVIVGDPADAGTKALRDVLRQKWMPNKIVASVAPGGAAPETALFAGRVSADGKATAYVCRDFACRQPTTDPEELARQLDEGDAPAKA